MCRLTLLSAIRVLKQTLSVCLALSVSLSPSTILLADSPGSIVVADRKVSPKIDGFLNEAAWQSSWVIDEFIQREPKEGVIATERTEVRIVTDADNLYIGVTCFDVDPSSIIAKEMERDSDLDRDDNFSFILDTFHDKRSGFYFAINPNGAQFDAQLGTRGRRGMNRDWDGVWDVRSRILEQGWSAEIVIPFKTLRFHEQENQTWGINFRRKIARKNEESLWRGWRRNEGLLQLTAAGELQLSGRIEQGRNLVVIPYFSSGYEKGFRPYDDFETGGTSKTGFDLKYALTPTLTADVTFNTDFAQVEADQEQVNLTRYSLFFPEKRDFFLENQSNFEMGSRFRALAFYSRRIGLGEERESVPILAGGRVTGKTGKMDIGLLSIQTRETGDTPATHFSVARFKRNIFEQSHFGMIYTRKSPGEESSNNQLVGADLSLRTSKFRGNRNLSLSTYFMQSFSPSTNSQNHAFNFSLSYPNDLIHANLAYAEVGENFNPELGYVRRTGARMWFGSFNVAPRPKILNLRKIELNSRVFYNSDFHGSLESAGTTFRPIGLVFQSGDEFEFNVSTNHDFLTEAFDIFDDIEIKEGRYDVVKYELRFETNDSRLVSSGIRYKWGGFFSGNQRAMNLGTRLRLSKRLSVAGEYKYTDTDLLEGSFVTHEVASRVNLAFNTRLTARLFLQWNNEDEEIGLNFRLRWIPRLGSDFFIVYNEIEDTALSGLRTKHRVLLTKLTYWWNL
jgi:hypothetical protein